MTTEIFKKRILNEINKFVMDEDMIALAKAQIMIEEVLKKEEFPFEDYKRKLAPYPFRTDEDDAV